MILCERIINTDKFAGRVDLITGIDDFKAQVTYDDEWHTYKLNGVILPSVTQLLDDGDYIKVKPEILEYSRNRGELVHKECQDYLEHGKFGFTDEFEEFLTIYTSNRELFNHKAIFDFKTYNQITPKKREKCYKQIKMYAEGIKYLTGEEINEYYMIWLPHNKKGKIIDLKEEFEK